MPDMTQSIELFLRHFGVGLCLTIVFVAAYAAVTPQKEFKLIREGNAAAALGVGGATLGFVIPLSLVLSITANLVEASAWGAVSLLVQLLGLLLTRVIVPSLAQDISDGKISAAVVQAVAGVCLGLLQAASWVP